MRANFSCQMFNFVSFLIKNDYELIKNGKTKRQNKKGW